VNAKVDEKEKTVLKILLVTIVFMAVVFMDIANVF
jgi:hypothetical protein